MAGPLSGTTVIEFAGVGPAPFCATMLADHGAAVLRIERSGAAYSSAGADPALDVNLRSRTRLPIDLKDPRGRDLAFRLARTADAVIEGFRPGKMEKLGLGPDQLRAANPALVYGRMTGWGQEGPMSDTPGHDINYLALSGVLDALGRAGAKPTPPLNLIGDYGGGLMLAFGIVAAILASRKSGVGQVIDCAMVDSAAMLGGVLWTFLAQERWSAPRGENLFDSGAHHYDTYACADGKYVAVGPIEPPFYAALRRSLDLADDPSFDAWEDSSAWPALKSKLAAIFATRTRDQWAADFEFSEACLTPVLTPAEAPSHPHNLARAAFVKVSEEMQPAPVPRFGGTPSDVPRAPEQLQQEGIRSLMRGTGIGETEIDALIGDGVVG